MKNLLNKIKKVIIEKRLYKTIKKKLYPYFKGFFLTIIFKKNVIKIFIPKKDVVDRKDLSLAEKIFKSYKAMKYDQKNVSSLYKPSSLWQNHIDQDFIFLKNSYENNDIEKFLFFLQNFGNWNNYLGIENQDLMKKYSKNIFLKKFLSEEIFNGQLKIWEYFNKEKIELKNLNMPRYGNLNGAYIEDNFIVTGSFFNEIYSQMVKKYLDNKNHNIVADLGGGYGRLTYYILKDLNNCSFINFDIPETLTLASYYLSKCFPEKKIFLYGQEKFDAKLIKEYDLLLLPSWEIEKLDEDSIELMINKNSLGEMEPEAALNYIDQIHKSSKYFFSVNHETFRNKFDNKKYSLINSEYNKKGRFKELIRYPDIGHLTWENNRINFDSEIFFYIYKKR